MAGPDPDGSPLAFDMPPALDPPHDDTLIVVKRLIGMLGDTLEMRHKTLYVNGQAQDEPYVLHTDVEPDFSAAEMLWQREILVGGPREN